MTRPSDEQPTTVLPQQTVEQPSVTTSPATRRSYTWHRRIPARIGRARTSTVIIGALFLLLGGLNVALPQRDSSTTEVTLESGEKIQVPTSLLPSQLQTPETPAAPTSTSPTSGAPAPAPTSGTPTGTSSPSSAPDDEEPTTTSPAPTSTTRSNTPSTSAPTTSARPSATSEETADETAEEEPAPTGTASPTG